MNIDWIIVPTILILAVALVTWIWTALISFIVGCIKGHWRQSAIERKMDELLKELRK